MTLTLQGNGTLNGLTVLGAPVTTLANTGTAASPSLVFDGDSDTGLFRPGANQLGLSVGGSAVLTIASDGSTSYTGAATFTKSGSGDVFLSGSTTWGLQIRDANGVRKIGLAWDGTSDFTGNLDVGAPDISDANTGGIQCFASGQLRIQRSGAGSASDERFQLYHGTTRTIAFTAGGNGSFGDASNSTNNNGVLIGGSNGSLNLYTTRYSTDCAQILNTSGSGNNIAHQFFGNGTLKVCGGDLQFANITSDSTNSVRITTDPSSTGSGSKLIFNMDASQDAVTIYNSGLKVGDSGNTERINLQGSNGSATFAGDVEIGTAAADARITIGSHGTAGTNDSVHVRADSANLLFMCGTGGVTKFEQNGDLQLVIDANRNVGINQATPTSQSGKVLHISGDTGGQARIHLTTSASGHGANEGSYIIAQGAESGSTAGQLSITNLENRDIVFGTGTSYLEKLRIQNAGGISFNGDTATANALDDYEEGTWTPTGANNFNSITNADGAYVKVGKIVWVSFQFNFASMDETTSDGAITGLPFTPGDANPNTGVEATNVTYGTNKIVLNWVENNNNMYFATTRPLVGSASTGSDFFRGSLVYSI